GLNHVDVNMSGATNTLDEVIVVGSGTQKKVSVTGSISSVSGKDLKMPASTLSRALGGKVAGLITKQNSGEPGTGADFYIRGISTFGGKSTPLILLDDVEITSTDLNFIPAESIESFTVLKDASATAIYGARGANGVMIVTTKGGDYNSKTKININIENSFNYVSNFPEWVDGAEFMRLYNKAQYDRNPLLKQYYSDIAIERTESGVNRYLYPDTDWRKELLRDMAMRQRANLNVSGGGTKAKYYMSIDFQHENGLQKSDKYYSWNNNQELYNYTFQNNISYKLTSTTNVSLNINSQIRQQTSPNESAETTFTRIGMNNPVDIAVYYPQGPNGEIRYGTKLLQNGYLENPKRALNRTYKQANKSTLNSVLKLDQALDFITKGLKFNAWVNWRHNSRTAFTRSIDPYVYYLPVSDDIDVNAPFEPTVQNPAANQFISESTQAATSNSTFELSANINWARKFGLHDLTAMVLYRMREYRDSAKALPNRNQGISGRVTYDYGHRYLAEFNFGYNGSERLTKGHRFGFFPAASLGWVVSNEHFWEPLGN
ncbi:MAG: SusC/RagA family TonB-linked outer membrane protein, partial [Muribaculaceae bacterium]|nr:SusC/RagA family TonB-linked outer membrane protein [Muribaculaceae bacterium]